MKFKKFLFHDLKLNSIRMKWLVLLGTLLFLNHALFSYEFYVITDPVPTVKEDKISYLEEVRVVGEDLGNDQYLFSPFSITADKANVFVYDRAQVRVFRFSLDLKLLGYFGSNGQGPGEFYSSGKTDGIEIAIGNDGNIYATNFSVGKIIGLDRQGKQLKSFYYGDFSYIEKPAADKNGDILFVTMKDGKITISNHKKIILAQCNSEKIHYGFFFEYPGKYSIETYNRQSCPPLTSWTLTVEGKLLVYFKASSSLAIFNGKEYMKTIKLWPQEALQRLKKKYQQEKNQEKKLSNIIMSNIKTSEIFLGMFRAPIVDQDNKDIFYLQEASDINMTLQKNNAALYAFNLEGKLLKVIYVPQKLETGVIRIPRIQAKVNNTFYATRGGEEIVLFKEKN